MLLCLAAPAGGQSGGFVTMLGSDTVQVEQFTRDGSQLSGTVVVRTPAFRVVRWTMTLDDRGRLGRYEAKAVDARGAAVLNGYSGSLTVRGDSVVREGFTQGVQQVTIAAAPHGVFPAPGIPYLGVSHLAYELGFAAARQRAASATPDTALYTMSVIAGQPRPSRTRAWLIGPDSAELDYFGVNRSGYRFDAAGRLIRSDWTGTTYRYRTRRVDRLDMERIADGWRATDTTGRAFGALSPRDTAVFTIGSGSIAIDYSRPSRRGRTVWGQLVPMDRVWRLGADMATHITTTTDIIVGESTIPAGRYTLWMIPSDSAPMLVVSSAVNVFGTNYQAARDLARIPLRQGRADRPVERLTIALRDGALVIEWDDRAWSVPVRVR